MGIAGGAVYVAYDSGLLSDSAKGAEALSKAKTAIPPAVEEWSKYFGLEVKYTRTFKWAFDCALLENSKGCCYILAIQDLYNFIDQKIKVKCNV